MPLLRLTMAVPFFIMMQNQKRCPMGKYGIVILKPPGIDTKIMGGTKPGMMTAFHYQTNMILPFQKT